jgi:hypothetical protein
MRGGSVSARNGMPPSVRGGAARGGRSNGPMFRVNLSAVTPGLNFASPSPAPTFDQPLYTMDGKMLTAVTAPLRSNTAMSNRPEVPRPEGTQGRTTNELTGKKGFNIQQSLMAPRFLYLAYLVSFFEASPLNAQLADHLSSVLCTCWSIKRRSIFASPGKPRTSSRRSIYINK